MKPASLLPLAFFCLFLTLSCTKLQQDKKSAVPTSDEGRDAKMRPASRLNPGFSCESTLDNGDVWLRSSYNGQTQFAFRIGAGGAVGELRDAVDGNISLGGAKTGPEDFTDRVFQDVYWSDMRSPKLSPINDDWRFNINQAGGDRSNARNGKPTPTLAVIRYTGSPGCRVVVYSAPQDQWVASYDQYMRGVFVLQTSYEMTRSGYLSVGHRLLFSYLNVSGVANTSPGPQTQIPNFLVNGWLPFSLNFDGIAFNVAADGTPRWYYDVGNVNKWNIASTVQTEGYAVLYNRASPRIRTAIGVAFGKKPSVCAGRSQCLDPRYEYVSAMTWNGNTGPILMPAIQPGDMQVGTVVERTYVLMPYRGLDGNFSRELVQTAEEVPASRILYPGAAYDATTQRMVEALRSYQSMAIAGQGYRGDHLGSSGRVINVAYDPNGADFYALGGNAPVSEPPPSAPQATPTPPSGTVCHEKWTLLPGAALDIGVGSSGAVWVIGSDHGIYHWTGNGWDHIEGAAVRIAVDPSGMPWVVNSAHQVFRRTSQGWQLLPGAANDIGIGPNGDVWAIGIGSGIFKWNGSGWDGIDGAASRIAVGAGGEPWVVNAAGAIFRRTAGGWQQLPGAALDIGVGAGGDVWVTGTDQRIYHWDGSAWIPTSGLATNISVAPNGQPWVATGASDIFVRSACGG